MKEAIGFAAGIITSLIIELLPPVQKLWANNRFKVLTLLGIHIGAAAAAWALSCLLHFNLGFAVACDYHGFVQLAWTGIVAFASSQVTYQGVTQRLPQTKARKLMAARERIFEAEPVTIAHPAPFSDIQNLMGGPEQYRYESDFTDEQSG